MSHDYVFVVAEVHVTLTIYRFHLRRLLVRTIRLSVSSKVHNSLQSLKFWLCKHLIAEGFLGSVWGVCDAVTLCG